MATRESNPALWFFRPTRSPCALCRHNFSSWEMDSNHQPFTYQANALTNCATSGIERIIGIEPMSPDWKSGTLPIKLYSHDEGMRNRTPYAVPICSRRSWRQQLPKFIFPSCFFFFSHLRRISLSGRSRTYAFCSPSAALSIKLRLENLSFGF